MAASPPAVILANRADGLAVSTFEPLSGLSGR